MMIPNLQFLFLFLGLSINKIIRRWSKPATGLLAAGILADLARSRTDLLVENAIMRQQLIILNRQIQRPQLTNQDRFRLVLFSRFTNFWQQALHIVQPDTLLRWHRKLFRIYWRRKSKSNQQKPHINPGTITLIKQMAQDNRLWGAERIRGELLKLGIRVSKRTIQRYMPRNGKSRTNHGQLFSRTMLPRSGLVTSRSSTISSSGPPMSSSLSSCIPAGFFIPPSPWPPRFYCSPFGP